MNARPDPNPRQEARRAPAERADPRRLAWKTAMEAVWALMSRFDEDLRESVGIDVRTYDVLLHTFDAGEAGTRMTALAREVVITKAGLTALVDRLEARGLLARAPDPDDRRATRIRLTGDGERLFRAAAEVHVRGIRERFGAHLSEEEARLVVDVFGRVRAANR